MYGRGFLQVLPVSLPQDTGCFPYALLITAYFPILVAVDHTTLLLLGVPTLVAVDCTILLLLGDLMEKKSGVIYSHQCGKIAYTCIS